MTDDSLYSKYEYTPFNVAVINDQPVDLNQSLERGLSDESLAEAGDVADYDADLGPLQGIDLSYYFLFLIEHIHWI